MATKAKSQVSIPGHWIENKTTWYEEKMFYCDSCGMVIPRKQYVVDKKGVQQRFCGTECAKLNERVRSRGSLSAKK
jgi:hypothetical protein